MTRSTPLRIAAVAALLSLPASARAGGLFVPGTGPVAQGRAGAFVAKADDATALFHNPAGFAKQKGWQVSIGANFVNYDLTFARAGSYEQPSGESLPYAGQDFAPVSDVSKPDIGFGGFQAVPIIAIGGPTGIEHLHVGFGIYAPQAYPTREFTPNYQFQDPNAPPPPQRYDIMNQSATTVFPSVAVAYEIGNNLDIGGRFGWGFGEVKAESYVWGIRNYEEWVARDGDFKVDVKDNFIPTFGLGALYRVGSNLELGASWSSAANFHGKGNGSSELGDDLGLPGTPDTIDPNNDTPLCAKGGTDQNHLKACVDLVLPQTATVGARYVVRDAAGREKGDVEFDVSWENWKSASDIHVVVDGVSHTTGFFLNETFIRHGFRDVISARLGGSYQIPLGGAPLELRGGVAYDTAAAPESWSRVDMDGSSRVTVGAGISYTINDKLRVDLGGGYVYEPNRTAPECNPSVGDEGCPVGSGDQPQTDRTQPDPIQPLTGPNNQVQSPFNAGTYKSKYVLWTLGLSYRI